MDGFLKITFFSKSAKVANVLQNAYQILFLKNVFSTFTVSFLRKEIRKFLSFEKLGNLVRKEFLVQKYTLIFF